MFPADGFSASPHKAHIWHLIALVWIALDTHPSTDYTRPLHQSQHRIVVSDGQATEAWLAQSHLSFRKVIRHETYPAKSRSNRDFYAIDNHS